MSLASFYLMEAIVIFGLVALEVPTGALADLIGRKKMILIGYGLTILGFIVFLSAYDPLMIWIGNIIWTIGFACISGADTSLLFESMQNLDESHLFKKVFGKAISRHMMLVSLGSLAGGFLYAIHPRLPMLLSLPGMIVAFTAVFLMKEPNGRGRCVLKEQLSLIRDSFAFVLRKRHLLWMIGFMVFIFAIGRVWFYTYNPYYEMTGLDVRWYGVLFFLSNVFAAITSNWAHEIEERIGEFASLACMIALLSVPIFLMGTIIALPLVLATLLHSFIRGYERPFFDSFMHKHVVSKNRATVLSVQSAARGLIGASALWIFGGLLALYPLPSLLQMVGVFVGITGIFFLITYKKIFV